MSSSSNGLENNKINLNPSARICPPTPQKKRQRGFLLDRRVEAQEGSALRIENATNILNSPSEKTKLDSPLQKKRHIDSFSKESEDVFAKPKSSSSSSVFAKPRTVRPGEFLEWANVFAPTPRQPNMDSSFAGNDFVSTEGMFAEKFEEVSQASFSDKSEIFERGFFGDRLSVRRRSDGFTRRVMARKDAEQQNFPDFISRAKTYLKGGSVAEEAVKKDEPRILSIESHLGRGSFVDAFLAKFGTEENNEKQVIKIHHFSQCKPSKDGGRNVLQILAYEHIQYIQLKEAKFPINEHYNFNEFLNQGTNWELYRNGDRKDLKLLDHLKTNFPDAFYRVEYVPHPLNHKKMVQEYNEKAKKMNPEELAVYQNELKETNHPLYQIKNMFQFAWERNIPLDLQAANLRLKEDEKTVLLCDLYYKAEPFSMIFEKSLTTFGSYSPIWDYFCPTGRLGGGEEEIDAAQFQARWVEDSKKLPAWPAKV